jgi:exodeoxyribonuclease V beta subunit
MESDLEIYDPNYHIALEASAGTGKTYNLTLRLLNLLLQKSCLLYKNPNKLREAFQEIIALTFTNKAAQDMKQRLLKYLKDCLNLSNEGKNNDIVSTLSLASSQDQLKELEKKALFVYESLLNDFSALEIGTLDSFFNSIIRLFPFETGVGLDVEIADEAKEKVMFTKALDKLLIEINKNKYLKKALLEIYRLGLARKDLNISAWLENLISLCLVHHEEIKSTKITPKNVVLKEAEDLFKAIEVFIRTLTPHLKHKNAAKEIEKLKEAKERKNIKEVLKKEFLKRNSLNGYEYFKNLPSSCEAAFKGLKQTIRQYVEASNKWRIQVLVSFYQHFYDYFQAIKYQQNYITFSDLAGLSYRLLVQDGLFLKDRDFFYYRLDRRVKHLLLDEFQDTSVIQWRVLEPLVNELIAGFGTKDIAGSFFYVGDKKQAIYRFRGGEAGLFDYVKNRFPKWIKEKNLPVNFRSAGGLIDFVNTIFNDLAKKENFSFYPQQPSEENEKAPFYIELSLLAPDDEKQPLLGKFISNKIKTLHEANIAYKDIAILVRQRATVDKFLSILKAEGIPCQSETQLQLLLAPSVRPVVALLHFLDNPKQKIHLFEFLTSKAINLSPIKIENIALSKKPLLKALPKPIGERIKHIWQKVDLVPLTTLLKEIYEVFGLFSVYPDKENVLTLLDIAFEFEKQNIRSLRLFLDYLDEKRQYLEQAKETLAEGVQIMTVHKAKGLEFEAVILPEMGYDCLKNTDNLIFKYNKAMKLENIYLMPNKNEEVFSQNLKKVRAYAKEKQLRDELNLLYVALTRAKSILVMIGQASKNYSLPKTSWIRYVTRALGKEIDLNALKTIKKFCLKTKGEILKNPKPLLPKKPRSFKPVFEISRLNQPLKLETSEPIVLSHPKKEQLFGEAFHFVMSHLKTDRDDLTMPINQAKQRYGLYLSENEWADIEKRVLSVLNCPKLSPYFSAKVRVLNECPLLHYRDKIKSYRVDRVVFLKDKIIVLDYKTQFNPKTEKDHIDQVKTYQSLLKKIFTNYKCEAYLIYALKNKVEIKWI